MSQAGSRRSGTPPEPDLRCRLAVIYGILAMLDIGTWLPAAVAAIRYPIVLGRDTAYGFDLRRAWIAIASRRSTIRRAN
jgi:hypothetical protein